MEHGARLAGRHLRQQPVLLVLRLGFSLHAMLIGLVLLAAGGDVTHPLLPIQLLAVLAGEILGRFWFYSGHVVYDVYMFTG